jgi:hypothetical protein
MEIDDNRWVFIPVPTNLPLVKQQRNMYMLNNGKLHFYYHSCSIIEYDDEDFDFLYEEIEGIVGEDSENYDAGHFKNIIELGEIIRQKSKKYPYFLDHKYNVIYRLKSFRNLAEFEHPWGFSIERYLYLAFFNYFIKTGVCDMEEQEKACAIDLENNEFSIKLQTSTVELLDYYFQKLEFLSDFICEIEIEERKTN